MCGRFSFSDLRGLSMYFKINLPRGVKPRYNIAPTQEILALVYNKGLQAVYFRWGLLPPWSKNIGPGLINARAETVEQKLSFRQSLRNKRCLLPADGFYEWKKEGKKKKPYRITPQGGGLFFFAGLWDTWKSPRGETINSCAIITTAANSMLKPIHNRMPVILSKEALKTWLARDTDLFTLKSLLTPYPSELLAAYEVSTLINNPRHDNPDVLQPLTKVD
ncbi:MAG: SOS response-associated peptidase [Firmicutes bacterium]|nr:SOS response-associated peptidase [Bacillota bacterium]